MKKVVVLAAVVMTAIASQAYDVKWSALNILTPAAKDVTKSETGIVGAGAAMSGLTVSLYWVSTSGDVFIKDYTSDSGKIASDVLGNESSDLYKAMVEDRGSSWTPQFHATATYTTADGVYTFDGTYNASATLANIGTKNVAATGNFKNGTWSYEANAVPEPTSGLLLLLGVAGLALRRRRA